MSEHFRPISSISRSLHYALQMSALAAWADALWPVAAPRDWQDHRMLGSAVAVIATLGWFCAMREGTLRIWRDSFRRVIGDARAMAHGRGASVELWEHLLPVFVPLVLILATVVTLAGLPSIYRFDGVFQPAAWVLCSRRIHAVAADAMAVLCGIEFIVFGLSILTGAGAHRPLAGPGAA